jgi:hypothetical protein
MTNRREFLVAAAAAPLAFLRGAEGSPQHRIWSPPADPALVLQNGPEGIDRRPKPPFAFLEEDLGGTNPKMRVKDAEGTIWIVKWAEEVHSETFASRLAAAAGYFVRTAYYVPSGRIMGCRDLGRAKERIDPDGSFESAVFKLIPEDQPYIADGNWAWIDNPFLANGEHRRQLNGLKTMLMLTSNWDAKDTRDADIGPNTAIYEVQNGFGVEYYYAFDDWGGSMGRWGTVFTRSKWDPAGYVEQSADFVAGVNDDGFIKWGYTGTRGDDVKRDISPADVAWLLKTIGQITDDQLAFALRDSGAEDTDVAAYVKAIRFRLTQLDQLTAAV